jgi:hypothetical protein
MSIFQNFDINVEIAKYLCGRDLLILTSINKNLNSASMYIVNRIKNKLQRKTICEINTMFTYSDITDEEYEDLTITDILLWIEYFVIRKGSDIILIMGSMGFDKIYNRMI